jgi:acetamidase/formamidase
VRAHFGVMAWRRPSPARARSHHRHLGLSADDAYSLASVAVDLGVTQVVDGKLGCHAGIARSIIR